MKNVKFAYVSENVGNSSNNIGTKVGKQWFHKKFVK